MIYGIIGKSTANISQAEFWEEFSSFAEIYLYMLEFMMLTFNSQLRHAKTKLVKTR